MEGLGELCLSVGEAVGSADEFYYCMDNDSGVDNLSRPSSVSSWTFSPITDDGNLANNHDFSFVIPDQPSCDNIKDETQQAVSTISKITTAKEEPGRNLDNSNQQPIQFEVPVKQINNQMNNYSEYVYPNNITYHHSVNIHNYVGNYCTPGWWGNQPCAMIQPRYTDKIPTEYIQVIEQPNDPMMSHASTNVDYLRCSTPDYFTALNSLNQLDSPPRPNHSAALTFPCTSFDDKSFQLANSPQQDSGYNSDLNVSPVIQYQDQIKLRRHTSTPNPHHGLQKTINKPTAGHPTTTPNSTRLMLPMYKPKVPMCPENMKPEEIQAQIYRALQKKIPTGPPKPVACHTLPQQCSITRPTAPSKIISMADFHNAKIKKAESKPKPVHTQTAPVKRKASVEQQQSDQADKKRRANEPLNQKAIDVMTNWYLQNKDNPYPNKEEKDRLAREGEITLSQVKSWFANKRNRSNNTRPKKQKLAMEGRLMEICHQLARDAAKPDKDNAYYIQQLSSIIHS